MALPFGLALASGYATSLTLNGALPGVADVTPQPFARGSGLPILVSLWFLVRLWREGELFGKQQIVFVTWFVSALIAQMFGKTAVWLAGLLAQVALAIVLVLKEKIDNIY